LSRRQRTLLAAGGSILGLLVLAITGFAVVQPLKVVPRLGLAPGYTLVDQAGRRLTSEDLRGTVAVYTFGYTHCETGCYPTDSLFRAVQDRLGEAELGTVPVRLVSISFDPARDSVPVLATVASRAGADPAVWTFATGEPQALKMLIGTGFGIYYGADEAGGFEYRPGVMIVDGNGILRREYRWGMPSVDGLLKDLRVIAREIQASDGAAKLAYEAAHIFACYSR
jgi:protein SCO1/2